MTSIATPHGIAAALKAEAPHEHTERLCRWEPRAFGLGFVAMLPVGPASLPRDAKRAARKIANRRKRTRGWR